MRTILLLSAVCFISAPVLAQGNVITIIRDDGTQEVIPLGGGEAREDKTSVILKKEPEAEAGALPPVQQRVIPPAQRVEKVEPLPAPDIVETPVPESKARAVQKVPSQSKTEKVVASPEPREPAEFVPKPQRKPQQRSVDVSIAQPLTQSQALNIALADAPPAKDFQVTVNDEGGALLYSVMFKTDEGQYEIVVDGQSGLITQSGYVDDGQASVKPGHLPVR